MEYKQIYAKESHGQYGGFGIRVLVACDRMPDLDSQDIRYTVQDATDDIESAILTAVVASDPSSKSAAIDEKTSLVGLFDQPIFVEEIPNGYCPKWCCKHLPWFVVTTKVGRITLGWRKRVISIEWEGSLVKHTAEELFPTENVTKVGQLIHAWNLDDAKRYIATVIESVDMIERG